MKFKGDISGVFFLVFPRELALISLEAMLGEAVEYDDTAAIVDGVAELCNIITGGAKVIFSNKKLKVLFELPKTYLSLQVALSDTLGSNGVWIDMQLDEKPFYMFITK
jgi:CheY-specific phosphatase CheX